MFLMPYKRYSAADNMAADLAMLEAWPLKDIPRLRFYGWKGRPYTCGLSQKPELVAALLPRGAELARRPSGGGIVAHGDDITYALVVPRGREICEMRARQSYESVHAAIVSALGRFGIACMLYRPDSENGAQGGLYACFSSPAPYDVVSPGGIKIAGAAQKRTRKGILFQGSVMPPGGVDRKELSLAMAQEFAKMLGEEIESIDFPF